MPCSNSISAEGPVSDDELFDELLVDALRAASISMMQASLIIKRNGALTDFHEAQVKDFAWSIHPLMFPLLRAELDRLESEA